MNKTVQLLVTGVVAASVLAGCGGDDPYCAAVKEQKTSLDSFGAKKTDKGLKREAEAVRIIATEAPDKAKKNWSTVGAALDDVLAALKSADTTLQAMADPQTVRDMDQDDVDRIRKAYDVFNETSVQRAALVKDIASTCDITLK
jgi:hypothetical protein